jgi:hypothetical protein
MFMVHTLCREKSRNVKLPCYYRGLLNDAVSVLAAIEKFPTNLEKATQMIKEGMDKKFGAPWHVVIGEGFSFEITYEVGKAEDK